MNVDKACLVLGVYPDISDAELKKKYHRLMNMTHPDVADAHDYPYEAHQINEAYEYLRKYLKKHRKNEEFLNRRSEAGGRSGAGWNAPVNPNAFAEREIYQYYEDQDGQKLGFITVDRGKYLWIPDEDYPLFLKSIYSLGKKIISDDDENKGLSRSEDMDLLADIVYLLAGQFFGVENALQMLKKDPDREDVYYAGAMLELLPEYVDIHDKAHIAPGPGESLAPAGIKNHRLYVRDKKGNVPGYITFRDDRILFGIIPLLERRAAMLRMTVSSEMKRGSADVDFWLKSIPEDREKALESINLKIRAALDR